MSARPAYTSTEIPSSNRFQVQPRERERIDQGQTLLPDPLPNSLKILRGVNIQFEFQITFQETAHQMRRQGTAAIPFF